MQGRQRRWVGGALVGLCVVSAYAGSVANGFTFDDQGIVLGNPLIRESRWLQIISTDYWWGSTGGQSGLYRPLSVASLAVDRLIFADRAWGYHLVNLIWHLIASLGLYVAAGWFLSPVASVCAGLFWGLHPVLTEAVDSVVGRAELLAGVLGLVGLGAWWQGCTRVDRSAILLAVGLGGLVAAPLAKENGICFALALIGWGLLHYRRRWLMWMAPLGAAALALGVKVLITGQWRPRGIGFIDNPLAYLDPGIRAGNGVVLLGRYLRLLAFPWPLSADYSYDQIPAIQDLGRAEIWISALLLLGLLGWVWSRAKKSPVFSLWAGLSAGSILLVGNILVASGTIFAERLLYIPAMGWCLGLGWSVGRLPRRGLVWVMAGWVLAAGSLVRTRTADWQDDLSLFRRAVAVCPQSARSHYGLGLALHERQDWEGAVAAYDQALRIYPRYADAHFNRGAALLSLDRPAEALVAYRQAVASRPGYVKALFAVATLAEHLEGPQAAVAAYQELLAAEPGHLEGARSLGRILVEEGRPGEAVAVLQGALARHPEAAELRSLLEEIRRGPQSP